MKKVLLLITACVLMGISSYAQVSGYSWSQANGTFDTLTTSNVLTPSTTASGIYFVVDTTGNTSGSATVHKGEGIPIGFNFTFNGSVFNVFGVNTDGWISFGQDSVDMQTSSATAPISATSTATAALQNRVVALGRTLAAQTGSQLSYALLGNPGSYELVIEWKKYRHSTTSTGDNMNFQIRLFETTNIVEMVYGTMTITGGGGGGGTQVGLRGTANTDFNNRLSTSSWATTAAGTANNSTVTLSASVYPASGLTFIWAPPLALDAGVTAINSPSTTTSSAISSGTSKIAVTVKNFGSDTLKTATIDWTVNGVAQTPYSFSGTLALSKTIVDTIGSYTFSTPGIYVIKAWTTAPNGDVDQNNVNDTTIKQVYVAGYASVPFSENFDHTWILNTMEVPSIYWTNSPNTGNSSWRRDDEGSSATWTTTTGAYTPAGAGTTPHSARFHAVSSGTIPGMLDVNLNFSTQGTKILSFWHYNTASATADSLNLYISYNNGTTFNKLAKYTTDASWTQYNVNLGDSTNPQTIIRFEGFSTANFGAPTVDFGIDSVQVTIQKTYDMAALAWVLPVSGCGLTNAETVTVKVKNVGADTLKNIPISYSINGGTTYTNPEIIAGPVPPNDTVTYSFVTTANFSTPGTYHGIFNVNYTGDQNLSNDTLSMVITVLGSISGNPFIDSLEHGNNYYTLTNNTYSAVSLLSGVGYLGTHGFKMTGGSAGGTWPSGTSTTTTPQQAFSYNDHHASINACVNASAFTTNNLYLSFKLKETYDAGPKYTYFAVVINGTDTLSDVTGAKYFNPTTASSDPFATKVFNLSAFAGTNFTMALISACKYNDAYNTTSGIGNDVYLDNIALSTIPTVNLGTNDTICPGSSVTLNAGPTINGYTYSYVWSTLNADSIATTQTISADSAATYIAFVNNGYGVTASDTVVVSNYAAPVVSLGHDTTNCGSYMLNPGTGYSSYEWSTNATTQTINVTTTGTYTVTVTNAKGCSASASVIVTITPLATATVTTQSVCQLDTLQIANATVANQDSLLWTTLGDGHFILDSTVINPKYKLGTVDISNKIVKLVLTVYSACNIIHDTMLVNITTTPTASAGSNQSICLGTCTTLSASGGNSYVWSPAIDLSSTTIANPVACPTEYTIYTVTASSSCGTASASVTISINSTPAPVITGNTSICQGGTTTLDAGNGYTTYIWSTNATSETISVSAAGTYSVTVTNATACSASVSATVTVNTVIANISASPDTICSGMSTTLTATGGGTYLWSNSATTASINVSPTESTTYTVTVTNGGCTATASKSVTVATVVATSTANPGSICKGASTTFSANGTSNTGGPYAYDWSNGSMSISFPDTPVNTTTYTVTVTSAIGCTATASATVTVNSLPVPTITANPDTVCSGSSTKLTATGGGTYMWNTGGTTAVITQYPTTTTTYAVTVENTNGCTASDDIVVGVIPLPSVYAGPAQSICYSDSVNVVSATAANYASLKWTTSGNGHFNNSTILLPVYKPGTTDIADSTVTLTLTAYAKCDTVSSSFVVTITNHPSVIVGSNPTICMGSSATLSASGGNSYAWSPATALSSTTSANPVASPTVTTIYTVTATSACGTASASVTVTVDNITAPHFTKDTTLCANSSITLNAGTGYTTYLWSDGATTSAISVDTATAHTGIGTIKVYVDVTQGVCSVKSDTMSITFAVCMGIVEYSNNASIRVFPNPTTGKVNIALNGISGNAYLNIINVQGQEVFNKEMDAAVNTELDLTGLSRGLYFIKITNEKTNIISKLIIQ